LKEAVCLKGKRLSKIGQADRGGESVPQESYHVIISNKVSVNFYLIVWALSNKRDGSLKRALAHGWFS
jgi:hypothetical protein